MSAMFPPYPAPVSNNDTRTALRDALIVAMVQAYMTRVSMVTPQGVAGDAHKYVSAANKIAQAAYPEDA